MAQMWIPGATRRPLDDVAPMNGGGRKVIWHTTSNPHGNLKLANELGWFTSGGAGAAPHVLYSPNRRDHAAVSGEFAVEVGRRAQPRG